MQRPLREAGQPADAMDGTTPAVARVGWALRLLPRSNKDDYDHAVRPGILKIKGTPRGTPK
jgi:hypothetical protein